MTDDVYVIDAYGILTFPSLCGDQTRLNGLLINLTELVESGRLSFPDLVLRDCRLYAPRDVCYLWAKAVAGSRKVYKVPNGYQEEALGHCERLLDLDDDGEQTQLAVAGLALLLAEASSVTLVTEDVRPVPERKCLYEACPDLGLRAATCREFVQGVGLDRFLAA